MEQDKLKAFVNLNRETFDVYHTEVDDWRAIETRLDNKQNTPRHVSVPLKYLVRIAAMVTLVLGAAVYTTWVQWDQQQRSVMMTSELEEAAFYYDNLIMVKVNEITEIDQSAQAVVYEDMEMLDEAFRTLKADLKDNADNEEVVHAMIANYKIKLEILEQILMQLKESDAL